MRFQPLPGCLRYAYASVKPRRSPGALVTSRFSEYVDMYDDESPNRREMMPRLLTFYDGRFITTLSVAPISWRGIYACRERHLDFIYFERLRAIYCRSR